MLNRAARALRGHADGTFNLNSCDMDEDLSQNVFCYVLPLAFTDVEW